MDLNEEKLERWSCNERGHMLYKMPDIPSELNRKLAQRTYYQRDIDQIIYSTVFRKLQQKSQLLPVTDPRRRTRLIHTLEVVRIAKEIGNRLGLDTSLIEAIALGHDLANSAYGSVSNNALYELSKDDVNEDNTTTPFLHEEAGRLMAQTLSSKQIKADLIELNEGKARSILSHQDSDKHYWTETGNPMKFYLGELDNHYYEYRICPEVLDGILNHKADGEPQTLEGQVVKHADNFAYISQDIDDLILSGIMAPDYIESFQYNELKIDADRKKQWDELKNIYLPESRIEHLLSRRSSLRMGLMIERFVSFNLMLKEENRFEYRTSSILEKEIPILKIDEAMEFIIEFIWSKITPQFYNHSHIKTAADIQNMKIKKLFQILIEDTLKGKSLIEENTTLSRFMSSLKGTRFKKYSKSWKVCYLISHLSWDEVDLILNQYQKRDYDSIVDIMGDAVYPNLRG